MGYARHLAIVFNPDEQIATVGVRKRNQGFPNVLANVLRQPGAFLAWFALDGRLELTKMTFALPDGVDHPFG